MILAAKVPDSVSAATAISTPVGRLLIFDPTDDQIPVGDLPWYEQGSYALLLANERGDLLKMPVTKPENNLNEVSAEATLEADGKLAASFVNIKTGQPAGTERHRHADENAEEYKSGYQRFLNENAKGAVISAAPSFPKNEKRVGPIVLRAALYRKTVRVKLPAGFTMDEAPSPFKLDSEFAKFSVAFTHEPGVLVMTEELRIEAATLPPDQFEKAKTFFDNCRGADRQNAVLVKN